MTFGAFVVTRTTGPLVKGFGPLDGVALMIAVSSLAIVFLIRQRFASDGGGRGGDRPSDQWWDAQLGRCVLLWCLLEFPAVIGAITLVATRRLPAYAILTVVSLGGLILMRPAKLAGNDSRA